MTSVAVIQARTGSTRLPGKVLEPLGGRPVLAWAIEAAQRSLLVDAVVVATTDSAADLAVVELGATCGVDVVTGSEDDVLGRFLLALDGLEATEVVRLTGDCPLLDPSLIDEAIERFRAEGADYLYLGPEGGFPRGIDTEVIAADLLAEIDAQSSDPADREHVTRYVRQRPGEFRVVIPKAPEDLRRSYRLCVDEQLDLELVTAIVGGLGDSASSLSQVVQYLDQRDDLAALNAEIEQKKL